MDSFQSRKDKNFSFRVESVNSYYNDKNGRKNEVDLFSVCDQSLEKMQKLLRKLIPKSGWTVQVIIS